MGAEGPERRQRTVGRRRNLLLYGTRIVSAKTWQEAVTPGMLNGGTTGYTTCAIADLYLGAANGPVSAARCGIRLLSYVP